jgi:uncharacterized protein with HEPN domain
VSRSLDSRLTDIRDAVARCVSYRADLDSADERLSAMAFDAILRNLGVIGEAVNDLPESYTDARPDIPWHAIAGLRNVIVHEYFRIDRAIIEDIVDTHLRDLGRAIE